MGKNTVHTVKDRSAEAAQRLTGISPVRWMAELDDGLSLRALSIPGTHDSGALYSFAGLSGKCQKLDIPGQLAAGVRYFDLRLRLVRDELRIYHSFIDQKAGFAQVLEKLARYLRSEQTEFLIVSLKQEGPPIRSKGEFRRTLEDMLKGYDDVICGADALPANVGIARGRMHIIARYEQPSVGVPCRDGWADNAAFGLNDMYIQDRYRLGRVEEKRPEVTSALTAAASGRYALVLNYASCYIAHGFPPACAAKTARVINPWLRRCIRGARGAAGAVVCDFITPELAMDIIMNNFR